MAILIADEVQSVLAVDFTPVVLSIHNPKVRSIQCSIQEYQDEALYDLIVIFGVMNFIKNRSFVYSAARTWLRDGGTLAIKHQCGREGEVAVSSTIDGDAYSAVYPYWKEERDTLVKCGFDVGVSDPYPPDLNPWPNTFFKMFLCR